MQLILRIIMILFIASVALATPATELAHVDGTTANNTSVTAGGLTMNTARLLGRTTASAGAIEEITVTGLSFTGTTLSALTYPVVFGSTTALTCSSGGVTTYVGVGTSNATENTNIQFIPTEAYVISRMYVVLNGNVPAGQSVAVAVMDNTVAQAVTCTVAAGAAICNDTAHSFTTVAGHRLDIRVICSGGATSLTAPTNITIGLR